VELLARLRPAAAVVQAARRNRFGFPHPEVVERYRQLGVAWLVTAEAGEIRMVSDGQISRLQRCRR
jgi:competence protein ComEC